jgi:exodeoxyribonuclease-3
MITRSEAAGVSYGLHDGDEPDEPRLVRAVVRGIPVVNTYVPQGREIQSEHFQYKLRWLERVRDLFERHYDPAEPLLWMGDLNVAPEPIDVHDPKGLRDHVDFHPDARAALERVREWGLIDVFRMHHPEEEGQYTYWDYRARNPIEKGVGWRIDHIWATDVLAQKSTSSWVDVEARRAARPSDHTFLVAEFDV